MKDSGFSVRVPTSMDVDSKKDGRIINSEGLTDKNAWGKRAKWVSYTGQVEGKVRGIAILNHPESFAIPPLGMSAPTGFSQQIHTVLVPLPRKKMVLLFSKKGSPLACAIASFSTKAILTRLIFLRRGSTTFQALRFALVLIVV